MVYSEAFVDRISELSDSESKDVLEALNLVRELHSGQMRPDGTPYVGHLLNVADRILSEWNIEDPIILSAAILHDSLEDQAEKLARMYKEGGELTDGDKALEVLRARFGIRIASIIENLTNPKWPEGLSREEGNNRYIEHVSHVIKDPIVLVVKLADFYDNGMRLDRSLDHNKRLKLSEKYLPLFGVFRARLAKGNTLFTDGIKEQILEELHLEEKKVETFLTTRTDRGFEQTAE